MKNSLIFGISLIIGFANCSMAQTDTISNNIFQSNGKLGIGQSSPGFLFHIEDSINAGDQQRFVFLNNKSISNTSFVGLSVVSGKNDTYSSFAQFSENYTAIRGMADYCQIYNSGKGIALTSSKDGDIRFMKNESGINSTNMIIKPEGLVGIGTDSPNSKLEITDGDIYINDIEKGIIMKSPDGNCWRGVLDNTGQLNFISIDCPEEKRVNSNQQLKSTENVLVFPNPAQNTITVQLNTQIEKPKYIICNLNGQIMDNGRIRSNIQPIDISELTTGVYMLNIYDKKGNKMTTEKIVKK